MIITKAKILIPESEINKAFLQKLERYARVCYKSEDKIQGAVNEKFLGSLLRQGHESVIEHEKITLMFVTDRGITHEIVRHRIGSYSQESTRYCNYSIDKFGNEITVIDPFFYRNRPSEYALWKASCEEAEAKYFALLEAGSTPQEARSVLPNSLKTEIVVTYNLREWRHFLRLRSDRASHPQIQEIAIPLLLFFKEKMPVLFDGVPYDENFKKEDYAQVIITDDNFERIEG